MDASGAAGGKAARVRRNPPITPICSDFLALMLCDKLPDLRDEIVRNVHDCLGRLNSRFVLQQGVLFGLVLVMRKYPSHFLVIPSRW